MDLIDLANYSICFTEEISGFSELEKITGKYKSVFILTDSNAEVFCLPHISKFIGNYSQITIAPGEKNKNIETCNLIWNELNKARAGRNSLVINLGGGVIGDMGGFAAGTYKRGIDFLNIPTTLLSQVDASVGGKTGIDLNGIKNLIGLFNNPIRVYISPEFLKTLPEEQLRSGFAEMLKHGLISDLSYWNSIKDLDLSEKINWISFIKRSVEIKKETVEKDPYEKGLRKILNFGHTIGHAIETSYLNKSALLLHGHAIAVGMICEAWLSNKLLGLSKEQLNEITQTLLHHFPKLETAEVELNELIQIMKSDKKNTDENISFSLLNKIGDCNFDISVNEMLIGEAINYYFSL